VPPRIRKLVDEKPADLKDILWKAADKLRGSMDAAEYKHFVLGLIFLKYASDSFDERRKQIAQELQDEGITGDQQLALLEDPDEYARQHIFWVPAGARWTTIAERAKTSAGEATVGQLLDGAMKAIGDANEKLKGALPQGMFNGRGVDARRLSELVDLINQLGFKDEVGADGKPRTARDLLGEVYEYCLEKFALAEGKRGGEYFTPKSIVKLIVEILEPQFKDRVYDPACGSGGMFVQAERFIEAHGGNAFDISVYGQELNQNTWRLATMNLAIHGISANLGTKWADSFHDDQHPDERFDVVMANPPFNISDWGGERLPFDPRWEYGVPPVSNANYAWLQHMAHNLSPKGRAGIVLANGSMSSKQSGEGDIRRKMVEADLIACMVAMPGQLFRSTGIPVCLWFLAKDKSSGRNRKLTDRSDQVLFIDARSLGKMIDRTLRELTEEEINHIADTYHAWRGTDNTIEYADVAGFCRSATLEDIRRHDFILTPGRYVGTADTKSDDDEPIEEKIARLTKDLYACFDESAGLEVVVRQELGRLDV